MADEPSPWELQRTLSAIRDDMRSGFADVNKRLDKVPTSELLAAWQRMYDERLADITRDVAEVKEERKVEVRQRAATNRMAIGAVFTALIAPVVVGLMLRLVLGG